MTTLRPNDKAFYDSFSGLVPVRIVAVHQDSYGNNVAIEMRVTSARYRGFKRGEIVKTANGRYVVPRDHVHVRNYKYMIRGEWQFAN